MRRGISVAVLLLGLFVLFRCTARKTGNPGGESGVAQAGVASAVRRGVPAPAEEPSAETVRRLAFEEYAAIEKAGGLPITVTATGKSMVLHPRLYEARKDSCRRLPQALPWEYECHLTIQLSLAPDGGDPSWQGERLFVKWDTLKGEWRFQ